MMRRWTGSSPPAPEPGSGSSSGRWADDCARPSGEDLLQAGRIRNRMAAGRVVEDAPGRGTASGGFDRVRQFLQRRFAVLAVIGPGRPVPAPVAPVRGGSTRLAGRGNA